ncbi:MULTISPECIES: PadR family transcriptional regulator [Actinoplanes]|nr:MULTISPECIES: helix-turn-helix transcriptional regulator [Actinoplanes]GIE71806.1 hypothetical protein Apa02nite_079140 [Actinoplanes palleronii]
MTAAVAGVLEAFLADPGTQRYGLEIMQATGYPSGTVYPILMRLHRAGWLTAEWEEVDPVIAERPARRWYRFTPDGAATARTELAARRAQHAAGNPIAKTRPTWAS